MAEHSNGSHRAKLPWFKFLASDWISDPDVTVMSSRQVGWYIRLLAYCWQEHGLPNDASVLQLLCGFSRDEMWSHFEAYSSEKSAEWEFVLEHEWEVVMSHFKLIEGRLFHPKLYQQLSEAEDTSRERSKASKRRWSKSNGMHLHSNSKSNGMLRASDSNSLFDSSLNGKGSGENHFELAPRYTGFYALLNDWPAHNRTGEDDAARLWISHVDIGAISESGAEVLEGLERWKASESWAEDGGKYIPSMAKFLRERKWKDHPKAYQKPKGKIERMLEEIANDR